MFTINGFTELKNGLTLNWIAFVSASTKEEADAEAIRVRLCWWKGSAVRCWVA